jgi:hypothetical protein
MTGSIITPFRSRRVVESDDVVGVGHHQRQPVVAERDRHGAVFGDGDAGSKVSTRGSMRMRPDDELDAGVQFGAKSAARRTTPPGRARHSGARA